MLDRVRAGAPFVGSPLHRPWGVQSCWALLHPRRKTIGVFRFESQVEVASLIGDVAIAGSEPKIRAHVVVTKLDASAWGGHLLSGHANGFAEQELSKVRSRGIGCIGVSPAEA